MIKIALLAFLLGFSSVVAKDVSITLRLDEPQWVVPVSITLSPMSFACISGLSR